MKLPSNVTIELDLDATLQVRLNLARERLVLYTALGDAEKREEWLSVYADLNALKDSSTVMGISLPTE